VKTTLSSKGHVVIPPSVQKQQNLRPGDDLEIISDEDQPGTILLRRMNRQPNEGLADWLRACPVKGIRIPRRSREMPRDIEL
jgi:AbrB family looped-hinge helix DNA binding protein